MQKFVIIFFSLTKERTGKELDAVNRGEDGRHIFRVVGNVREGF